MNQNSIFFCLNKITVNGDRHWINCRNNSNDEIIKWIELLRGQNGNSGDLRLRKMWQTNKPSIQGPWTPFTHRHPSMNLVQFPDEILSKPVDIEKSATEHLIEIFEKQKIEESNLNKNRAE